MQEPQPPKLSPREAEVLTCISNGKTLKETALALKISRRTVVFHLRQAKERLGAVTRNEAIALAVVYNLVVVEKYAKTNL